MYLSYLVAENFRLYRQVSVCFAPGVNVILGSNAQGKTSLLEAVYFLSTGQGLAAARHLIRSGQEEARVEGVLVGEGRRVCLVGRLSSQEEARHLADGVPVRLAELYRVFPVVPCWTDDAELVRGEPERRRRFLDGLLARLSAAYLAEWRRYRRALGQRNACLRAAVREGLEVWEEELARAGGRLVEERQRALRLLARRAGEIYFRLSGGESLTLSYVAPWLGGVEGEARRRLLEALRRARGRDEGLGHTSVGPHRDDIAVFLEGCEVRGRASRGQQKDAALALRLAQAAFVEEVLGRPPVLLLDDVFAELDARRRAWLGEVLKEVGQVLLTATERALLPPDLPADAVFTLAGGQAVVGAPSL